MPEWVTWTPIDLCAWVLADVSDNSPFPVIEVPQREHTHLLVVFSTGVGLDAARTQRQQAPSAHIVLWSWLASEDLARRAEQEFPVVFGKFGEVQVQGQGYPGGLTVAAVDAAAAQTEHKSDSLTVLSEEIEWQFGLTRLRAEHWAAAA